MLSLYLFPLCVPVEWDDNEEDKNDAAQWEDNWDDDTVEDEFSKQLR